MSKRIYPYAVMDGNESPDMFRMATSCHYTMEAASRACDRLNKDDANAHYYVVHWNASRWAKERPMPEHPEDIRGETQCTP